MVENGNKAQKHEQRKTTTEKTYKHKPDLIARKLLMNGKTKAKKAKLKFKTVTNNNNTSDFNEPFEIKRKGSTKGIMTEQIKQLGCIAKEWLLIIKQITRCGVIDA